MTTRKKKNRQFSLPAIFGTLKFRFHCGWGIWVLIGTLALLSFLAGIHFETDHKIYVAGQIAETDIIADRDILVEDQQATRARRKQVQLMQPPVYDLSFESYTQFQNNILEFLHLLETGNFQENAKTSPNLQRLLEELTPSLADEILPELENPKVQDTLLKVLLPMIRERLAEGLVGDVRAARIGRSGVIIRNLDTKNETLRAEINTLPDIQSFLAEISSQLRQNSDLNPHARRAINILLSVTMPASLTLNREASQKRADAAMASVEPVIYQLQKGEKILRKGEKVSREQQIKLQAVFQAAADSVHWNLSGGSFLFALVIATGFFVSPSGKPGTPLHCKDILLISILLMVFGLCAKGAYIFSLEVGSTSLNETLSLAFPVAGAVGLVAMVFAARRYCTMGLLLAFFAMIQQEADFSLFLYYFLGGMLTTWLISNAQNRQDVVWSIIPLTIGQLIVWSGYALSSQVPMAQVPVQIMAVFINSLLTLIMLFAVSPVLEMAFCYSTRFRLMELMSLEQPLMQELMVTIPGTYHHSLVVANMVEAGAKAIGANSLLCKVAALYHDVGKLSYPEYFIENQFGGPNKHDKLAPSMSALILLSHVKKGTELAETHKLGQEICDIIRQHHGTRLMRFFYKKALDLNEKPREADYSYPGPRPQTKEAAILMLADSVEASSRTLSDPTPARIKNHIDSIIKGIFAEGQLDESELTFKDLHFLSENFQRILTGIFHQRIAYPEAVKESAGKGLEIARQEGKTKPGQDNA